MAATTGESRTPRAMIHKRILDVARDRPDASMAAIADAVSGASVDLVERVLDEYGDPAESGVADDEQGASEPTLDGDGDDFVDEGDDGDGGGADADDGGVVADDRGGDGLVTDDEGRDDSSGDRRAGDPVANEPAATEPVMDDTADGPGNEATAETVADEGSDTDGPNPSLSEEQLEVLRTIRRHPDASQREIGRRLGVSASTVCNRLAAIDGFEWTNRWQYVRDRFEGTTDGGVTSADSDRLDELERRVEAIEERAATSDAPSRSLLDPALVHKVVHACVASEHLSEAEELEVIRALLGGGTR